MQIFKIALRNTGRQLRRTGLLAGAIAFGTMIIIILNSFTNGLSENVRNNMSQALAGHIYITADEVLESGRSVKRITDERFIIDAVEESGIDYLSISHRTGFSGTISFGPRKTEQRISGINTDEERLLLDSLRAEEGSLDAFAGDREGIVLSSPVAFKIGASAGDQILVRLTTATGQNNLGEFTISAILPDEGAFGSDRAYAHIDYVNELVNMPEGSSETINIMLADIDGTAAAAAALIGKLEQTAEILDADEQAAKLNSQLGSLTENAPAARSPRAAGRRRNTAEKSDLPAGTITYKLNTVDDYTSIINQLVSTLNYIGYAVFTILLLITMVGVTNTYRMMMLERISEIGTMRAIGLKRRDIKKIFLYEAGLVALLGAAAGLAAALIVMLLTSMISVPNAGDLTMLLKGGRIGYLISPFVTGGVFTGIICLSMAAVSGPAKKAAKIPPAEALRAVH